MTYIQPVVFGKSFTCPHCGAIAMQNWWNRGWDSGQYPQPANNPIRVGSCQHCGKSTFWVIDTMYYPDTGNAPFPNPEMPESVKKLYNEAASVQMKSPRGAAALLRLGIQVLCKELGETGKNINDDIASLVKKGLPWHANIKSDFGYNYTSSINSFCSDRHNATMQGCWYFQLFNFVNSQCN